MDNLFSVTASGLNAALCQGIDVEALSITKKSDVHQKVIACSSLCCDFVLHLVEWNCQDPERPPEHISRESETIPGVYSMQLVKQPLVSFIELVAAGHEKQLLASFDIAPPFQESTTNARQHLGLLRQSLHVVRGGWKGIRATIFQGLIRC